MQFPFFFFLRLTDEWHPMKNVQITLDIVLRLNLFELKKLHFYGSLFIKWLNLIEIDANAEIVVEKQF